MASVETFLKTMSAIGYEFEEQDGNKLQFKKERSYSTLVLVIDLGLKSINPILVPKSVIMFQKDIVCIYEDFQILRADAKKVAEFSGGKLKVLN